jgi:lipopolysaccharide export system permease protein
MKLVDRHVLRSHLGPFLFGFLVTTGVLFTEVFKNFLDEFLAKGVAPLTIAEVLVLSLGHTVALSIPMAVLVATLMAFGQLTADNEITALKAAGLHVLRIMLPVLLASAVVCAGMLLFNNFVLPESNHRLAGLTSDIGRKRPTVTIEPGRFVDDFKGYQLYVGDKDEKTDEVRDVQVVVLHAGHTPDLLVAPRGRLHFEDGGNTLYVDLYDGEMQSLPEAEHPGEEMLRRTRFTIHTVIIRDVGTALERTDRKYRSDREMNLAMMRESIAEKRRQIRQVRDRLGEQSQQLARLKLGLLDPERRAQEFAAHGPPPPGRLTQGSEERLRDSVRMQAGSIDAYERQIRSLQVEIHKKWAIPFACIVFVLVGAPLAIRSGRSSMTIAIAFSILCFFIYYLFLTGGEKLADRELLSPAVSMWAANVVFGILGIWLTWQTSRESEVIRWERLDPRGWARPKRWRVLGQRTAAP